MIGIVSEEYFRFFKIKYTIRKKKVSIIKYYIYILRNKECWLTLIEIIYSEKKENHIHAMFVMDDRDGFGCLNTS